MFTCLVCVLIIGWCVKNICNELGVTRCVRHKIEKKFGDEE